VINRTSLLPLLLAGAALLPASLHAQTATWTIDPNHSSVQFETRHLGLSTVHGNLTGVKGTILLDEKNFDHSSVEAVIDATTVNTGVEKRDTHLKSDAFFNIAKYPTLTFKSTKVVTEGGKHKLIGDLTLAGVTNSVTLDLDGPVPPQVIKGKTLSAFTATGVLSRAAFKFGPGFPPAAIGDEVKFTIDVEIDKQ